MPISDLSIKNWFSERLLLRIIWIHWRIEEILEGHANPASRSKNLLDSLLAMASIRLKTEKFSQLIELGANPAIANWLPFRMAACAGETITMRWLCDLSPPNDFALSDARAWAKNNGHDEACKLIDQLNQPKT